MPQVMAAAYAGDLPTLRRLLNADPSLANRIGDAENSRPIHYAAGQSLAAVELLLSYGADPLACGNDGNALHMAAWFGNAEVVDLLVARGIDVNAVAGAGETPLHFAALRGHEKIAETLLKCGATPNVQTTHGPTDMFYAQPPVVGETPLHLAAAYGHAGIVRLLLAHGADKSITDRTGQTPRHWAGRHDQEEIAKWLA
jgi:ankyrin repeat protein